MIDYLLVSDSIRPLLGPLLARWDVSWAPHCGLDLKVWRAARFYLARSLNKPGKLPLPLEEGQDGFDTVSPLPWAQAWTLAKEHVASKGGASRLQQSQQA